jgi:hypothetical protein
MRPDAPCQEAWRADAVFVGRVLDVRNTADPGPFSDAVVVTLAVAERFVGVTGPIVEIRTGRGGGDCGFGFDRGREYLVYAGMRLGRLTTSICSRTAAIGAARSDLAFLRSVSAREAATGRLAGTVTHWDYDYERATVTPSRPVPGVQVVAEGAGVRVAAVTDEDGRYEIRAPVGTYALRYDVPPGLRPRVSQPFVTLIDARGCARRDVILRSDGVVTGEVVTPDGKPVPYLQLELYTSHVGATEWRTRTDEAGRYTFNGVAPGRYLVGVPPLASSQQFRPRSVTRVLLPGTTERAAAVIVDVRPGVPVETPRFVLPASEVMTTVTGTVVTADARPVSGARVVLLSAIGDVLGDAVVTGADGRFAVSIRAGAADRVVAEWLSSGAERPDRAESPVVLSAGAASDIVLVLRQAR